MRRFTGTATTLFVTDLPGTVIVSVGGDTIEVEMNGPSSVTDRISFAPLGDGECEVKYDTTVETGRAIRQAVEDRVVVWITVPKRTELVLLLKGSTRCVIGDTEGRVHIRLEGSSEVIAGKLADAEVEHLGTGTITIREVQGNVLVARVGGSARLCVFGGKVGYVVIRTWRDGRAEFRGTAEQAWMLRSSEDTTASSEIRVHRAKRVVKPRREGDGKIVVNGERVA